MTLPTPAQVEALIERLKKAPSSITIGHAIEDEIDPLLYEAGDMLAALRDENAALRSKVNFYEHDDPTAAYRFSVRCLHDPIYPHAIDPEMVWCGKCGKLLRKEGLT